MSIVLTIKLAVRRISFTIMPLLLVLLLISSPAGLAMDRFNDLNANHWAYTYIIKLSDMGIINGYPDGSFCPEKTISRAEFIRLVISLLETPRETQEIFKDIPETDWANPWVAAAVRRGVIIPEEYGAELGVHQPITREEAVVWMVRMAGEPEHTGELTFSDNDSIGHQGEIASAVEMGLVTGMPDNTFVPKGITTRAQAAVMISRLSDTLITRPVAPSQIS